MRFKLIYLTFSLLFIESSVYAFELCGHSKQGEILIGFAPNISKVEINKAQITPDEKGVFLLALGRDQQETTNIKFHQQDTTSDLTFTVTPTAWDIQNIKGIPPRKVTPSESDIKSIEFEQKSVKNAQQTQTNTPYWRKGFIMPIEGRTSGNFGGQRIMNGIKKNPHAGMDIAAPSGTPIKSSGDGIVTLAQKDLFYSGNVVIIDHGYGLHTIYAHLQQINVKKGDFIKQGDIIGSVGATGRATGPHLHWGASVHNTKFNPLSLLNINKASEFCFTL